MAIKLLTTPHLKQLFKRCMLCFIMTLCIASNTASANDAEEITGKMGKKFSRGIVNTVTGALELPRQMYISGKNDGVFHAVSSGLLSGIIMTVVRTTTGVIEVATFYVPAPGDYDPILEPALVWSRK